MNSKSGNMGTSTPTPFPLWTSGSCRNGFRTSMVSHGPRGIQKKKKKLLLGYTSSKRHTTDGHGGHLQGPKAPAETILLLLPSGNPCSKPMLGDYSMLTTMAL